MDDNHHDNVHVVNDQIHVSNELPRHNYTPILCLVCLTLFSKTTKIKLELYY